MAVFTGAGVAIATPFDENYNIDYESFGKFIDFQVENKTDAIIVCGTSGEASTLSHEEHIAAIRYCVNRVNKRIPVIAGTGSNCTDTASYLTKQAQNAGADAALVVTPYYNKATQKGLIGHYSKIAQETRLPIIMYNVPGRTGCNLLPETVAELFRTQENIVGLKEATGNLAQASKTMYLTDGKLDLYSGEDGLVVPLMSIGGIGVISVWANLAPAKVHNMCESFFKGDLATANQLQREALPLIDALFCEVNPIPVKEALNLMGKNVGPLRSPLCEMEPANKERLIQAMRTYGLKLV